MLIIWIEAAVRDVKQLCVTKCFQKAGFKFDEPSDESETDSAYDSERLPIY